MVSLLFLRMASTAGLPVECNTAREIDAGEHRADIFGVVHVGSPCTPSLGGNPTRAPPGSDAISLIHFTLTIVLRWMRRNFFGTQSGRDISDWSRARTAR
jgi:hypothetical protein